MFMRTRLFDKASSVVACYQEGKNAEGENNQKQPSQTGKPRIRDQSAADDSRDYRGTGCGIEGGPAKETQDPKDFPGEGANAKNHSFAGRDPEQGEGCQTQNYAKP